jgi:hypothetical protein
MRAILGLNGKVHQYFVRNVIILCNNGHIDAVTEHYTNVNRKLRALRVVIGDSTRNVWKMISLFHTVNWNYSSAAGEVLNADASAKYTQIPE